jgi:sulfotransferase
MKDFHMIAGLPRSGSTLLCQILNMNPDFQATQTSPLAEMLNAQQSVFSHSPSFKAVDRMDYYDKFADAQKAFIKAYYSGDKIVFDKNRGWTNSLRNIDEIFDHSDSKVIWTYRDPIDCIVSMEKRHRKYPLFQFPDEKQVNMATLEGRIQAWTGDGGILARPVIAFLDAVQMGYGDRIHLVDYQELCENTQVVMEKIHKFLGIKAFKYDINNFKDLKQTTTEHDNLYNYKFPHDIKEGEIKYVEANRSIIPQEMIKPIQERFGWLYEYVNKIKVIRNRQLGRGKK